MLELKFIRENQEIVRNSLLNRKVKVDLDVLLSADEKRRSLLTETEDLRAKRNLANDEISRLLKEKKDTKATIDSMKEISSRISALDAQIKTEEEIINRIIMTIPNVSHISIPVGDPTNNKTVRTWGEPPVFDFKPKTHFDLSRDLDIIDFACATKITGSNFVLFKGLGARLERALINFMLDLHTSKHGYTEIWPPLLVNRASMTGTGQLPKLEEDMYRLKEEDLFLIPTAEVPVTNIMRDEVLEEEKLPVYFAAYTACFRREAGSYGKDTKGLVRVHQFDKVEMVKFVKPESSYDELEKLLANAEKVLQLLGLPYRVVMLSTQDISFAAAKCYDIEAYSAGLNAWLEVSSCSNFESFQARRANIKFKTVNKQTNKPVTEYVHTLNGSGVALARTIIAIIENYQQKDGSILIPEVLRPYMDGRERIFHQK